jgi:hypothetical protein
METIRDESDKAGIMGFLPNNGPNSSAEEKF